MDLSTPVTEAVLKAVNSEALLARVKELPKEVPWGREVSVDKDEEYAHFDRPELTAWKVTYVGWERKDGGVGPGDHNFIMLTDGSKPEKMPLMWYFYLAESDQKHKCTLNARAMPAVESRSMNNEKILELGGVDKPVVLGMLDVEVDWLVPNELLEAMYERLHGPGPFSEETFSVENHIGTLSEVAEFRSQLKALL